MDFKQVTDELVAAGFRLDELADEIGASRAAIYQARLDPGASGYRGPPDGWQAAAARLARRRGGELTDLAERLESEA